MGKQLGSLKSLGSLGKVHASTPPEFVPSLDSMWESADLLTPEAFVDLEEKYGDEPEWMKIEGYREGRDPISHRNKSEMLLSLRGKSYWFPLSPNIYEKFISKIVSESRGDGLRYLQKYIRRYRQYKERWPSKRYVRLNKITRDSFMDESDVQTSQVGLTQELIDAILEAFTSGIPIKDIAKELRLSILQVESVLNASASSSHEITDRMIKALADGDLTVKEAVSSLAKDPEGRNQSKKAFRVLSKNPEHGLRSMRIRGQKSRSQSMRVNRNSL